MSGRSVSATSAGTGEVPAAGRVVALKNLQQQSYDLLLARILRGDPGYEPGSRLNIPELADELGISLTPIKESLRLLQAHGLVEMSPRRGTFIASLTRREFDEHVDLLRELEFAALRLARGRLGSERLDGLRQQVELAYHHLDAGEVVESITSNQAFHESLVGLGDNRQLLLIYSSPRAYLLATTYRTNDVTLRRHLIDQHRDIVAALASGDTDAAMARITGHWEETRRLGHHALRAQAERSGRE